ncbi:MAG: hypothetical protein C4521_13390 [Actinobacteria bacterium]|nr:MAG: hypothetical protein C4521_13390 [Actinomycetota bacterium]
MPKTRILAAALVAALLFAAGCRQATTAKKKVPPKTSTETTTQPKPEKSKVPGYRTFADPDAMFTVLFPEKWFANGSSSLAVEASPLRSNTTLRNERNTAVASVELRAGRVREEKDNAILVRETVKGMLEGNPAGNSGPLHYVKMGGGQGAWMAVEMASKQGTVVKTFVAIGGTGERRVIMLGSSPSEEWNKNLPVFLKIAESFKFVKKDARA